MSVVWDPLGIVRDITDGVMDIGQGITDIFTETGENIEDFLEDPTAAFDSIFKETGAAISGSADKVFEQLKIVIGQGMAALSTELGEIGLDLAGIGDYLKNLDFGEAFAAVFGEILGKMTSSFESAMKPRSFEGTATFKQVPVGVPIEGLPSYMDPEKRMTFTGSSFGIGSYEGTLWNLGFDHPLTGYIYKETDPPETKALAVLMTIGQWAIRAFSSAMFVMQALSGIGEIYIGRSLTYWANWEMQNELLAVNDYIEAYRRLLIPKNRMEWALKAQGFSEGHQDLMIALDKFQPSVPDLVDFAVKEAFDPRETLLIHGDNILPVAFVAEAPKSGLSIEWAERYWHSHWRLMSLQDLNELWRRNAISDKEYDRRLRLLDFDNKTRSYVRKLQRVMINRVDSRRLFDDGIITTQHQLDLYGAQGYNKTDSTMMLEWAKNQRSVDPSTIRKHWGKAYTEGFINEIEYVFELIKTGLTRHEALKILYWHNKDEELENAINIKNQLIGKADRGRITLFDLDVSLRELGVTENESTRIKALHIEVREAKEALPTKDDIKRWLKLGLVTGEEAEGFLRQRNYDSEVIQLYLIEWGAITE